MDTESLLKLLRGNAIEFVIIGASAFPVHGYSRVTLDVDIFIRPERDDDERGGGALCFSVSPWPFQKQLSSGSNSAPRSSSSPGALGCAG